MLREAVAFSSEVASRAHVAHCVEGSAAAAEALGDVWRSARLIGAAKGLRQTIDEAPFYEGYNPNLSLRDLTAADLRSRLGKAGFDGCRAEGRAMTFEQAVEYALTDNEDSPT